VRLVAAESIRVMTFNLWVGGDSGKQPLSQTLEVIRAAKADVVGLQETHGHKKDGRTPDNGQKLAEMLGWNYFDQGERTAILTRFTLITNTPRKWGVSLRLPSGREAWMFNAHLMHAPYQPYQLLGIPYADAPFIKTAPEAVSEARKARGDQVERLLSELKPALATGQPVFLTGDFNEPSHQDWTNAPPMPASALSLWSSPPPLRSHAPVMRDTFRSVFPTKSPNPAGPGRPQQNQTTPKIATTGSTLSSPDRT
jgi:endonuclease/exonuclease/phosphatase family metal-dependent hydrolase